VNRAATAAILGLACAGLLLVAAWSDGWFLFERAGVGLGNLPADQGFERTWAAITVWASLLAAIALAATVTLALLTEVRRLALVSTSLLLLTLIAGFGFVWGAPRAAAIGFSYPTFLVACLGGLLAAHLARTAPGERAAATHAREQGDHLDGKRHGRWLVYDATDTLIRIDIYDRGDRTSSTPVGPDGRPLPSGPGPS
jgi:hypothetical protein